MYELQTGPQAQGHSLPHFLSSRNKRAFNTELGIDYTSRGLFRLPSCHTKSHERRIIAAKAARIQKELEGRAAALSSMEVSIARAVGEAEKLYGSVTNRDIAAALLEKGVTVDSRKIQLDEPIKSLGTTEVAASS